MVRFYLDGLTIKKEAPPPEKFIAMAEKNNLLLDLTELSLLKLANQLMAKKQIGNLFFLLILMPVR